jgi:nucleoside-diphosphate-sugar epimerase
MKALRIIVIGGAGYVGVELLKTLRLRGHQVFAIVRSKNAFLAQRYGVEVLTPEEAGRLGEMDAVVNLAYPTSVDLHDNLRKTRQLSDLVIALGGYSKRVIHLSTQAVFGYDLRLPIITAPVKLRLDHGYIESKILMENLLLRSQLASKLRIVRLGNVWGPASPTWTVQLSSRLFFQQPMGALGVEGWSNVTDVANTASYVCFLLEEALPFQAGIDHLAELGDVRWPRFIHFMAGQLGVDPVLLPAPLPPENPGWKHVFREIAGSFSPKKIGVTVLSGREPAALLRRVLEWLPEPSLGQLRKRFSAKVGLASPIIPDNELLLQILTCQVPFKTSVLPGWTPPVDYHESTHRVAEWIKTAGFLSGNNSENFQNPN